jgi:hypothetical protein
VHGPLEHNGVWHAPSRHRFPDGEGWPKRGARKRRRYGKIRDNRGPARGRTHLTLPSEDRVSIESTVSEPSFKSRVFLCGADMHPTAIRQRWPRARFLGIGWVDGIVAVGLGLPPFALGPQLWGILLEVGVPQRGMPAPVTMRDGTGATAMLTGDPEAVGKLPEMLAEARYWELPRAYRERIEAAIDQR